MMLGLLCTVALALAPVDTIKLADGKTLENVTIVDETLKEVTFKQDGKSKGIPSDSVVAVEFTSKPKLVEQADSSARDGDIEAAIKTLEAYVDGLSQESVKEPLPWAPAYAMQRVVELSASLGDTAKAVKAADRLIHDAKDSRYVPFAYSSKAVALMDGGQPKDALATIAELRLLIESQGLGLRWKLEADLAEALCDPSHTASARRARFIEIAGSAGKDFPLIAHRARVNEGESYIAGDPKDFSKAEAIFREVVSAEDCDARTLAAAYTGLGDCLYSRATLAGQDANASFKEAAETYMRAVVLYPDQPRYRAKAMFLAGRSFELLGDEASKGRARLLYRSLMREYKNSSWAGEAKKQMGG